MRTSVFSRLRTLVFVTTLATVCALVPSSALAVDYGGYRPHYQGFGVNTPGGRGGVVCKVTSVSDTAWPPAPGTLRYCLEQTGPRFVVFETSGTIQLARGPLFIRRPNVTIAGQTAPSPGIVIRGPGLIIDTHDVVVQHIRVRVGNLSNQPVAIWCRDDCHKVVLDHVSASWGVWDGIAIAAYTNGHPTGEIAVIDSIVSEPLACSGVNTVVPCDPSKYPAYGYTHSRAIKVGDGWGHAQPKASFVRNLVAHANDRLPEINGGTRTVLVNNVLYNPSQAHIAGVFFADGENRGPAQSVLKGNVLIPGPSTPGHNGYLPAEYPETGDVMLVRVHSSFKDGSLVYMDGNYYAKHCGGTACLADPSAQWRLAKDFKMLWQGISIRSLTPPFSLPSLPLSSALPHDQVEAYVLANAGARPLDRDAVDARIVSEVKSRTGSVPNRTSEKAGAGTSADGFPILAVNVRPLTIPPSPNQVVDSVGRTRIEEWLESFARALEPSNASTAPPAPPTNLRLTSN